MDSSLSLSQPYACFHFAIFLLDLRGCTVNGINDNIKERRKMEHRHYSANTLTVPDDLT